jgi:hypothetical protein
MDKAVIKISYQKEVEIALPSGGVYQMGDTDVYLVCGTPRQKPEYNPWSNTTNEKSAFPWRKL